MLLGLDNDFDAEEYEGLKAGKHRDSSTVVCDVERSLWFYTEGMECSLQIASPTQTFMACTNRNLCLDELFKE